MEIWKYLTLVYCVLDFADYPRKKLSQFYLYVFRRKLNNLSLELHE